MRKPRVRIVILIILAVAFYMWQRQSLDKGDDKGPSTIDSLINSNGSGDNTTGEVNIDIGANAGGPQYEGGGEYTSYSSAGLQNARQVNKRIIIVFETNGDPSGDALHEDIVKREARIPKNTVIFFANIDSEASLANTLEVDNANTIIYIDKNGKEIRRIGNGVITLTQIVNGIDGLVTK